MIKTMFFPQNMKTFTVQKNQFSGSKNSAMSFPVPFDVPPERYSGKGNPRNFNMCVSESQGMI